MVLKSALLRLCWSSDKLMDVWLLLLTHVVGGQMPQDRTIIQPVLRLVSLSLFIGMCLLASLGIITAISLWVFNCIHSNKRYVVALFAKDGLKPLWWWWLHQCMFSQCLAATPVHQLLYLCRSRSTWHPESNSKQDKTFTTNKWTRHPVYNHAAVTRRLKSRTSFMVTSPLGSYAAAPRVNEWHKHWASPEESLGWFITQIFLDLCPQLGWCAHLKKLSSALSWKTQWLQCLSHWGRLYHGRSTGAILEKTQPTNVLRLVVQQTRS